MASKYKHLDGLGRCTISLHGLSSDRRTRMVIAQQLSTQRIHVVTCTGKRQMATPVTSMPPGELLTLLARYALTMDFVDASEADAHRQLVAGR